MSASLSCLDDVSSDRLRLGDPALASEDERRAALIRLIGAMPVVLQILEAIRDLRLPDAWLVSGGIYQNTWNLMTGKPVGHGIKDYDVTYFDGGDLSYDAEDRVIRSVAAALPALSGMIETRNQARVHLWYPARFGGAYPRLTCSTEALTLYASKTHAVAARMTVQGEIEIAAPFGLAALFAMRLVPNRVLDTAKTHAEKSARLKRLWPELQVIGWDDAEA